MKMLANEETLRHKDIRRRPSGLLMHTAHGGTHLGARASKVSPAGRDLAQEDVIGQMCIGLKSVPRVTSRRDQIN